MDKVEFQNRITAIGACENEAERRELLTQLQEAASTDYDRMAQLETDRTQLTADNEALRSANMKLFLRIGDHKPEDKDPEEKEKREFKNLFNEKGGIK